MKKSKFTEDQIAFALKQAELGTSVKEEYCAITRAMSWPTVSLVMAAPRTGWAGAGLPAAGAAAT